MYLIVPARQSVTVNKHQIASYLELQKYSKKLAMYVFNCDTAKQTVEIIYTNMLRTRIKSPQSIFRPNAI